MQDPVDTFLMKGCLKSKSTVTNYLKQGGLLGFAFKLFNSEINIASNDKDHSLHRVAQHAKSGNLDEATKLLYKVLSECNPDSLLSQLLTLLLITLPTVQLAIKEAKEHFMAGNDNALQHFPEQILYWAAMDVGEEISNRKRTVQATSAKTKYSDEDKLIWANMADDLDPDRKNISKTAEKIAEALQLPKAAIETIRKTV